MVEVSPNDVFYVDRKKKCTCLKRRGRITMSRTLCKIERYVESNWFWLVCKELAWTGIIIGLLFVVGSCFAMDNNSTILQGGSPSGFQSEDRSGLMRYLMTTHEEEQQQQIISKKKTVTIQGDKSQQQEEEKQEINSKKKTMTVQSHSSHWKTDKLSGKEQSSLWVPRHGLISQESVNQQSVESEQLISLMKSEGSQVLAEMGKPFWVEVQQPETTLAKSLRLAGCTLLAAGVANGMIPVYLQMLEENGLQVESWLSAAMAIVGGLYFGETFLERAFPENRSLPPTGWKQLTLGMPMIAMPCGMLAAVEVNHHQLAGNTGWDQYMTFLMAVGPFLVGNAILEAWELGKLLTRPRIADKMTQAIDRMPEADVERVWRLAHDEDAVALPLESLKPIGMGGLALRVGIPIVGAIGSWACFARLGEELGMPFEAAAVLAVWPTIAASMEFVNLLQQGTWHQSLLGSVPYALFKSLPFMMLSWRGLEWIDEPAYRGLPLVGWCLQKVITETIKVDRWLERAVLQLPKFKDTIAGKRLWLKDHLSYV